MLSLQMRKPRVQTARVTYPARGGQAGRSDRRALRLGAPSCRSHVPERLVISTPFVASARKSDTGRTPLRRT